MASSMDDRPLGGGGYNINWDEIDELSDPFSKNISKSIPMSPTTITPKGDEPPTTELSQKNETENTDGLSAVTNNGLPGSTHHSGLSSPLEPTSNQNPDEVQMVANPTLDHVHSPVPVSKVSEKQDTTNAPPSAEEITAALEQVALSQEHGLDDRLCDSPATMNRLLNSPSHPNTSPLNFGDADQVQQQPKIDSSTRPASPAQNSLLVRPKMTDSTLDSLRAGVPVTEAEVIALRKERDELVNTIDEMRRCIAEYDRSLQHLIEEKSQNQAQVNVSVADLIAERDQVVEEVATIEKAFGDLHRRFEKSKQVIEGLKQNEDALKRSIQEYKTLLQTQENKYLALKKHAEEKLLKVTQETDAAKQEAETNASRLRASLRMLELQNRGLEAQLEQKQRENAELTKICEELLNKYSGAV